MLRLLLVLGLAGCGVSAASPATVDQYAAKLAPLIDPAKLKTLGERGANPRVQKAVAILADARAAGVDPGAVCSAAVKDVGMKPAAGELTKTALVRNLDIAGKLGCASMPPASTRCDTARRRRSNAVPTLATS